MARPGSGGAPPGLGRSHRGARRALDERPDLLGDAAPVRGRGQLAEEREQAQVDPLQDHVGPGNLHVGGERAAEVEEAPGHRRGVGSGHGPRAPLADGVVEHRHVLHDHVRGQRGRGHQEARVLHGPAEPLGIVLHAQVLDHLDQRPQLVRGEVLDQAEIQEGDPAAPVEQVVPRVRVAIEGVRLVQAAEDEAVDRLGGQVTLGLGPAGELGEPRAVGQVAGHQPPGGQLGHDPGHADRGVAGVVPGEHLLVPGFPAVVELLGDAFPQLGQQRVDVLHRRGDLEHAAQQRHVAQVGLDRLGDARVLHLDRDGPAVVGDRAVHLPDRGGRDGFRVPGGEGPLRRLAQLFRDDLRGQLRAHRRHAVLQPAQRPPGGGGQAVVDVAGHLAQLHQHALHRPQGGRHVLGGLQGQVVPQRLAVLARAGEEPGGAGRVPRAPARRQPHRRHPPLEPQPPGPRHAPPVAQRPAAQRPVAQQRQRGDRHAADPCRDRQAPRLHFPPAPPAERIRTAIRCLASSTPGSPRKTASSTPRAWRISVRRPAVSGGGSG